MQRDQRWVAAAVVLAAGSVIRADPFDLALTTSPTANVAMGSGLYAASGAGATLAISDLQ
jgi:hypothetical protein